VFGAFSAEEWHVAHRYYGTGETFVFTLRPKLAVFKWTGKNPFYILSAEDSLAMGGGGTFALWLDADFSNGSSMECSTFRNACLASQEQFTCLRLECFELQDYA